MKESHGDWLALKNDSDGSKGKEKIMEIVIYDRGVSGYRTLGGHVVMRWA